MDGENVDREVLAVMTTEPNVAHSDTDKSVRSNSKGADRPPRRRPFKPLNPLTHGAVPAQWMPIHTPPR